MRTVCLLFVLYLCSMHIAAQRQTFEARIIDADTGEPMPCVGVYIEAGRTTLTNFDGDFSIEADSSETYGCATAVRCAVGGANGHHVGSDGKGIGKSLAADFTTYGKGLS